MKMHIGATDTKLHYNMTILLEQKTCVHYVIADSYCKMRKLQFNVCGDGEMTLKDAHFLPFC